MKNISNFLALFVFLSGVHALAEVGAIAHEHPHQVNDQSSSRFCGIVQKSDRTLIVENNGEIQELKFNSEVNKQTVENVLVKHGACVCLNGTLRGGNSLYFNNVDSSSVKEQSNDTACKKVLDSTTDLREGE